MQTETSHHLSGQLLEWPGLEVERSNLTHSRRLGFTRPLPAEGWEEYEFVSTIPLRGEERPGVTSFRYPVTCRRGGPRLLVLSLNRHIVAHLMATELCGFFPPLCPVGFAVDRFVKEISAHPSIYTLSFIHARVPAFGASLRSASFYGDDLAEASLFRDHLRLMTCFTCGVKKAAGGSEIARIGNEGSVSFMMGGRERLGEVETFLAFLQAHGFTSPRPGVRF